jgi:hypothetical protein
LLQHREGGGSARPECDDLAVEHGVSEVGCGQSVGDLRVRVGHVLACAAEQCHVRPITHRDGAIAVPLHLERPVVLVVDVERLAGRGEHRRHRLGAG